MKTTTATNITFIAILVKALRDNTDPERTPEETMEAAVNAQGWRRAVWATFDEQRRARIMERALKEWREGQR